MQSQSVCLTHADCWLAFFVEIFMPHLMGLANDVKPLTNGSLKDQVYFIIMFIFLDCVHTMPAQFENGRKIDSKNSFLDFDAKEK